MWNPAEQPWLLLAIAAVLFMAVAILRAFFFEKPRKWLMLLPILITVLAFVIDFAIQTDREQIKNIINTAVKAVEDEDVTSLDRTLATDYSDSKHRNKNALLSYARIILVPPFIQNIYKSILDLQISDQTAQAVVLNRVLFDPDSEAAGFTNAMAVTVRIDLEKQPYGRWLIRSTEITSINNNPAGWKDTSYR